MFLKIFSYRGEGEEPKIYHSFGPSNGGQDVNLAGLLGGLVATTLESSTAESGSVFAGGPQFLASTQPLSHREKRYRNREREQKGVIIFCLQPPSILLMYSDEIIY